MNLINGTHHSCEKRKHAFIVLRDYTIISLVFQPKAGMHYVRSMFNNYNLLVAKQATEQLQVLESLRQKETN